MSELKNFQSNLDNSKESKQSFVDNEIVSDDSDSENEQEQVKIITQRKNKGKNGLDTMLLEQSITQQNAYLKAQRTIYKLRSEIDVEEVKLRYLKLDLNNVQVKLDEQIEKNKILNNTNIENTILRVVLVIYTFFLIYGKIFYGRV
jgi:hypothetical protein